MPANQIETRYRCPECGRLWTIDELQVLGADDGQVFCPACLVEFKLAGSECEIQKELFA